MRRMIGITAALLLAGTGTALADHGFGWGDDLGTVKSVTATFTATTATNVRTTTCTGSDGATYAITRAEYSGSAVSTEPTLNGSATVDVAAVIDTTHDLGTVSGTIRIGAPGDEHHSGIAFQSVYGAGKLSGLAAGKGVVANLSAGFSAAGGFTNGQLGGTTGGGAVLVSRGGCQHVTPDASPGGNHDEKGPRHR